MVIDPASPCPLAHCHILLSLWVYELLSYFIWSVLLSVSSTTAFHFQGAECIFIWNVLQLARYCKNSEIHLAVTLNAFMSSTLLMSLWGLTCWVWCVWNSSLFMCVPIMCLHNFCKPIRSVLKLVQDKTQTLSVLERNKICQSEP